MGTTPNYTQITRGNTMSEEPMHGKGTHKRVERTQPTCGNVVRVLVGRGCGHEKLRGEKYTGNASWILKDLTYYYKPIYSTVYALNAVRSALLKRMSVQGP